MARMRVIGSSLDKGYRDDLNYNFGLLEALIGEANGLTDALRQEMLNYINNLQQQIDMLTGENIGELLERLNDSIQQALTAAQDARTAKTATEEATALATAATELANASALLAEEKANYANEKAVLAQEAADNANQEASNLSQLKIDVVQATQNADTATGNANQATQAAQTATNAINVVLPNVEGLVNLKEWNTETQYKKNNFVTLEGNGYMALRDNKGVKPPSFPVLSNADWAMFVQKGEKGEQGTGVRILGTLPDESALPPIGEPGDAYLINGDLYVWSDTTNDWTNVGTIKGPKGDTGPQGPQGEQGLPGKDADLTEVNQEIANIKQTVTDNKTEVTEHLEQVESKANNSWQKSVKNDVDVMNLGDNYAEKVLFFPYTSWKSSTNVEVLSITIPFDGSFSGLVRTSITSYWGGAETHGGATILFRIGNYVGNTPKLNSIIIENISNQFARDYYINGAVFNGTDMTIEIIKAPNASNPMTINLAVQGYATGPKGVFTAVNEATVTAADTGSPTAGKYPWYSQVSSYVTRNISNGDLGLSGNLSLYKGVPVFEMGVPNTAYSASMMLNASTSNDFGLEFRKNNEIYNVVVNKKDVRFLGHDDAWFSIQDLKSSVSDGKAAVNQAVTDMGVYTPPDASYATTAANIKAIPKGKTVQEGTMNVPVFAGGSYVQVDVVFTGSTARNVTAQCGGRLLIHGMYYGTSAVSNGLFVSNIEIIGSIVRFTFHLGGGVGTWTGGSIRYTITS